MTHTRWTTRWFAWGGAVALALMLGACVTPPGGGTNANTNDNTDGAMTADEAVAVETSTKGFNQLSKAVGSATLAAEPRNYQGGPPTTFGDCPEVSSSLADTTRTVTLDYGDGCESTLMGGATVSGDVTFAVNGADLTVEIDLNALNVDGAEIDGTISGSADALPVQGHVTITADVNLLFDSGLASGQITFSLDSATGEVTVSDTTRVTLADSEGNAYTVTATGVVIHPADNSSLIPDSGTLTIELPSDTIGEGVIITVTFDENSPTTGIVHIQIGDAPAFDYPLPFFEAP